MKINRNNRRSVPTLVISGLGVVAAAITWLSFNQASTPAPPATHPNATANEKHPAAPGAHVRLTTYTQQVVAGVTNFDLNRKPSATHSQQHAE